MKKIQANVKNGDRIIVDKSKNALHFYYQYASCRGRQKQYLFSQKFSLSVYKYFGCKGRTLGEIYDFNKWGNPKLTKTITRLPIWIEYVLKEENRSIA